MTATKSKTSTNKQSKKETQIPTHEWYKTDWVAGGKKITDGRYQGKRYQGDYFTGQATSPTRIFVNLAVYCPGMYHVGAFIAKRWLERIGYTFTTDLREFTAAGNNRFLLPETASPLPQKVADYGEE